MQSLTLPRRHSANGFGKAVNLVIPAAIAALAASAAYAGADTTFTPALTKFTDFLEGSGGKIITVLSLAGGLIGLASGRFSLSQVAVPVGVGIGVGTGVPIVTSVVTAVSHALEAQAAHGGDHLMPLHGRLAAGRSEHSPRPAGG